MNTHKKARSLVKENGPLDAETDSRQAGESHSAIVPQVSSLIKPQVGTCPPISDRTGVKGARQRRGIQRMHGETRPAPKTALWHAITGASGKCWFCQPGLRPTAITVFSKRHRRSYPQASACWLFFSLTRKAKRFLKNSNSKQEAKV